jgi:hypothetical protein
MVQQHLGINSKQGGDATVENNMTRNPTEIVGYGKAMLLNNNFCLTLVGRELLYLVFSL